MQRHADNGLVNVGGFGYNCGITTTKGKKMKTVKHSLNFVTEFDETHPVAQRFLSLDEYSQIAMLEGMLKELILPAIQPKIDEINAGGTYAILKVAN